MPKIYIDTNIFLDFYQSSFDRLKIFTELVARADAIILTEQTLREFRRNRAARLELQAKTLESRFIAAGHVTAVIRELPQFSAWQEAQSSFNKNAKEMANQLRTWIHDEKSDLVLNQFGNLVDKATILPTTDIAFQKAKRRKLTGEPPSSPDKYTVGDELIWETLLESCNEDLIIVSRDNGFINYDAILKSEFYIENKRKLTLVTKQLSKALEAIGKPSLDVNNAEKILQTNPDWEGVCSKCKGELITVGFEGSDDRGAWWMSCIKCGNEEFPANGDNNPL